MTKRPTTRAEIDHLAARLDQIEGVLSDHERTVLRIVFDLARDALSPLPGADDADRERSGEGGRDRELPAPDQPDLLAGFEDSFQSGGAAVFAIEAIPPTAQQERRQTFKVRLV